MTAMDGGNIENAGAFFDDTPSMEIKTPSIGGLFEYFTIKRKYLLL
jgi:hypothetical protein